MERIATLERNTAGLKQKDRQTKYEMRWCQDIQPNEILVNTDSRALLKS